MFDIDCYTVVKVNFCTKQGWINGKTVMGGWAGAVMQTSLAIKKCEGQTDGLIGGQTD